MKFTLTLICAFFLTLSVQAQSQPLTLSLAHTSQHGYLEVFNEALDAEMRPAAAHQKAQKEALIAERQAQRRSLDTLLVLASKSETYDNGTWIGKDSLRLVYDQYFDLTETRLLQFDGFFWVPASRLRAVFSTPHQKDSLILETFDGLNWSPVSRHLYQYDANGNEVEDILEYYQNGSWAPQTREQYTHTPSEQIASWQHERFQAGSWSLEYRNLYEYHPMLEELSLRVFQKYEGVIFENQSRQFYDYDPAGNMLKAEGQFWNFGSWEGVWKNDFLYNVQNQETRMVRSQYANGNYVQSFQVETAYDAESRIDLILESEWTGFNWANEAREVYTYPPGKIEIERQEWVATGWKNDKQQVIQLNDDGQFVEVIDLIWGGDDWLGQSKKVYAYGPDQELVFEQSDTWDLGGWIPMRRAFYHWLRTETTPNSALLQTGFKIGPNPVATQLNLRFDQPLAATAQWELRDLQGRMIAQRSLQAGTVQHQWQRPDHLAAGLYLLRVQTSRGLIQQKIRIR